LRQSLFVGELKLRSSPLKNIKVFIVTGDRLIHVWYVIQLELEKPLGHQFIMYTFALLGAFPRFEPRYLLFGKKQIV